MGDRVKGRGTTDERTREVELVVAVRMSIVEVVCVEAGGTHEAGRMQLVVAGFWIFKVGSANAVGLLGETERSVKLRC